MFQRAHSISLCTPKIRALGLLLVALGSFTSCGGSSSETPFPAPPLPAYVKQRSAGGDSAKSTANKETAPSPGDASSEKSSSAKAKPSATVEPPAAPLEEEEPAL